MNSPEKLRQAEQEIAKQLDSLKRVAEGIQAAVVILENRDKPIGNLEPFFQEAVYLLIDQIAPLNEWASKILKDGPKQQYDLLFRYETASTVIYLRSLELDTTQGSYLVLFINPRKGELPTIKGLSSATVRKIGALIRESRTNKEE